jgi:hypothetical protein
MGMGKKKISLTYRVWIGIGIFVTRYPLGKLYKYLYI